MELSSRQLLQMNIRGKIIDVKYGASGEVYIVDNGENYFPRMIAYKTFQEKFKLNEEKQNHFIEECTKWFKLRNPYIVTPFYAKVIGGQPFICMPFCDKDLKSLMLNHQFTFIDALVIICQLIKAMLSLEQKGFNQHQDLNPPNIMLNDITRNYPDWPTINLMHYKVSISDFGMLDLYRTLGPSKGVGGGKFPFKAPEQYLPDEIAKYHGQAVKFKNFKPDTFALGVVAYMLLSGSHPNGFSTPKALNKNTSSSGFREWAMKNPSINFSDKELESLINGCLSFNPENRPSLEEALSVCMNALRLTDSNSFENIKIRFNENDKLITFIPRIHNLRTLRDISELPGQREDILKYLRADLNRQKRSITNPYDVIYYCRTVHEILLLIRKADGLEKYIVAELHELLKVMSDWQPKLTAEHLYPSRNDAGVQVVPEMTGMRDIEATANFTSMAFYRLGKIVGEPELESYLSSLNDKCLSALYYYHLAQEIKEKDTSIAIEYLKHAKEIYGDKNETIFDDTMKRLDRFATVRQRKKLL